MEETTWILLEQIYYGVRGIGYFTMSWLFTMGLISLTFGITKAAIIPLASFAFIVNVIFWGLLSYGVYLEERK